MKKQLIYTLVSAVAAIAAVILIYQWFFCRFYVGPGQMAVITAKNGKEPAPGAILVGPGERGIRAEVLPEGRYFLDPVFYDVAILPAIRIPLGKVGVVTSKVGKALPAGEIIAPDHSYKGIWAEVLGPGLYRLNPQGYTVEIYDAVNIPVGYVGIITSQAGPSAPKGEFAKPNQKGILQEVLQPGMYYLNPRAYQVNLIEIGMNQVSMSGRGGSTIEVKRSVQYANNELNSMANVQLTAQNYRRNEELQKSKSNIQSQVQRQQQSVSANAKKLALKRERAATALAACQEVGLAGDFESNRTDADAQVQVYAINKFVEFPSRDGFQIRIDMTVEFELLPERIAKVYMLYGDLPQVVDKIILPQILSVSRMKGSSYKAQDFIVGEGRETFQRDLTNELVALLASRDIVIHNAIIRNVEVPGEILQPIQAASLAKEQKLTNRALEETAKILADFNTYNTMVEQKCREIDQETKQLVAVTDAERNKAIKLIDAQTNLESAKINLLVAKLRSEANRIENEARIQGEFMRRNEAALGLQMRADALDSKTVMADFKLIERLNNQVEVNLIYAGEGTMWTDLTSGAITLKDSVKKHK